MQSIGEMSSLFVYCIHFLGHSCFQAAKTLVWTGQAYPLG